MQMKVEEHKRQVMVLSFSALSSDGQEANEMLFATFVIKSLAGRSNNDGNSMVYPNGSRNDKQ